MKADTAEILNEALWAVPAHLSGVEKNDNVQESPKTNLETVENALNQKNFECLG